MRVAAERRVGLKVRHRPSPNAFRLRTFSAHILFFNLIRSYSNLAHKHTLRHGSLMVNRHKINSFVRRVAQEFRPRQIILFGSYAYGKPTPDSDVDLLVVMPHKGPPSEQAATIRKRIRAGFPMDLIVRSPDEIRKRTHMGDCFIREIMERGQPLYEC